jgi:hypothetical protein
MLDIALPLLSVNVTLTPGVPTLVGVTLKPTLPETDVPSTVAVALTVVAPAAAGLAALIWIEATPDPSVSAVAAGTIVASEPEVAKVTTVLGTTAPSESLTVAVTFAGLFKLMLVTAAPVLGLVSTTDTPVAPVLVGITLKPTLLLSAFPPTEAVALTVVAPEACGFAEAIWIHATPEASVNAVPEAGIMVARDAEVEKLTTVLGTSVPAASRTVAVTLAGLPVLMLVTARPLLGLVRVRLMPVTPAVVAITL